MSYPTTLAPWFIVQQLGKLDREMTYYSTSVVDSADSIEPAVWSTRPRDAMLFMSLQNAVRVARATGAEVRVLTSKDELAEFRPEGAF